ncbi:hypothetical protein INS49_010636 [Diaporthe citri]|uniref:uncharacterized protein n=1 Tax=Diaporthe citri TaxID=83186 RepID=UPI001C808290|nr:uncharacterized protein INS49_010636 [Diaporthe citri]KAG6362406.1 hypothetical protein INS49_010636 [Diaporthe citri]
MDVAERVRKLPVELQLIVLVQTVHAPKVHFLKPFKNYNGGLVNQPHGFPGMFFNNGEPGVEEVSPQSGASKLAKLFMEINVAAKKNYNKHLTSIALNPSMFPINTVKPGVPHIKVDMVNDVFCVSSNGQYPFFSGERFCGGVSVWHKELKNMHRVCMGLPSFDLAAHNYYCQDCDRNHQVVPQKFPGDNIEFCNRCIGLWFARLIKLEQVYIIVPGLPKAQTTDQQYISRYGELATVDGAFAEAVQKDPTCQVVGSYPFHVNTGFVAGPVIASHTVEGFGNGGPCSFEGNGITLYEVAASDVPDRAVRFMDTLVRSYARKRVRWTYLTSGTSPPPVPEDPKVCDGMVEFKFLSFSQGF